MKPEIEGELAPLRGLPLWGPARASNLLTLQFGERIAAPDGGAGAYALHVFCAWRLSRDGVILAGSADLFVPADPDAELEDFDYDAPGATWWDARWAAYAEAAASPPTVAEVAADALGGVRLGLSDGAVLEVFPNSAPAEHVETEFWRLLRPGRGEPHVVVGTAGVQRAADA